MADQLPIFAYGELEEAVARVLGTPANKRGTLQSRLKQWQKLGFPPVQKVGRGARTEYTFENLMEVVFHVALLSLGITPERSIGLIKFYRGDIISSWAASFRSLAKVGSEGVFAFIQTGSLSELTDQSRDFLTLITITEQELKNALRVPTDKIDLSAPTDDEMRAMIVKAHFAGSIVVNVTGLASLLIAAIDEVSPGKAALLTVESIEAVASELCDGVEKATVEGAMASKNHIAHVLGLYHAARSWATERQSLARRMVDGGRNVDPKA